MYFAFIFIIITFLWLEGVVSGILFPQDSETREIKSLNGIWEFKISPRNDPGQGFREEWFKGPLSKSGDAILMPVPSSYNDVTQSKIIRDHVGWAWYDREFQIPKDWRDPPNTKIWLRFGSVNYHAIVWVNGFQIVEHLGGHLPFKGELKPSIFSAKGINRVTVAVNNVLSSDTIPQGRLVNKTGPRYPSGYFTLDYNFDFFNYAGIHRPVYLYTTPAVYIDDITVATNVINVTGVVSYRIDIHPSLKGALDLFENRNIVESEELAESCTISVQLLDKNGTKVAETVGAIGQLSIDNAKLWWPFSMVQDSSDAGYLYTFAISLKDTEDQIIDVYRLKVGIRTVTWDKKSFRINSKPFYFRGFGRHEDFNIRGRGIDPVMTVKDHNLIKWFGANSYRTSHYPYAEEIMDLTDELGIVIIDEISAVAIDGFGSALLANHKQQIAELIQRDKNRPSVVMWSVSNEPQSQKAEANLYFRELINFTKHQDNRPVTVVLNREYNEDKAGQYADIICINRYFGWYSDTGHTELISNSMILEVEAWVKEHDKPVIVTEYGADTIAGLHSNPDSAFSEDYQWAFLEEYFKAFDYLRKNSSLVGEMIWNFADFMTAQGITRVAGNRKGILTRERQPKAAAHLLRTRYHVLGNEIDGVPIPEDVIRYQEVYTGKISHTEL